MRAAAALLAGLALAGCGLPQPFRHAEPNPLLQIGSRGGVVVGEVAALPRSDELAAALAEALQQADVAATTGPGNAASFRVDGSAAADESGALVLTWRLWTPDGRPLASHSQRAAPAMIDHAAGPLRLAAEAAPAIAALLAGRTAVAEPPPRPKVAIRMVSGAPGDGNAALTLALRRALGSAGYAATTAEAPAERVVHGRVALTPGPPGHDMVRIEWLVADADGRELGRVDQGNPVPSGSLDDAWGELAHIVAAAAAPGIDEVLRLAGPAE